MCELCEFKNIDWLLVQHDDESERVTLATEKALRYLRALRQSIPTPAVSVCIAEPLPAGVDDDEADDGATDGAVRSCWSVRRGP